MPGRGKLDIDTHTEKTMGRHREKRAIYKPSGDPLEKSNPDNLDQSSTAHNSVVAALLNQFTNLK